MWLLEIKKGICRHKLFTAIMIAFMTIDIILINFSVGNAQQVRTQSMRYQQIWDRGSIYWVYDRLYMDPKAERAFFRADDSLVWIKQYIHALESNERYPYYINGKHQLEIHNCKLPAQLHLFLPSDDEAHIVGAVQFNERYMDDFPIALESGRGFYPDDYFYYEKPIPVILGHAFKDVYELGDTFEADFMAIPVTCEVVGFAEKDTVLALSSHLSYLDKYVIMPVLHFEGPPRSEDEAFFQKANYLQHSTGFFRVKNDAGLADLVTYFESTKKKFGVFPIEIAQLDDTQLTYLHMISSEQVENIHFLAVTLAVLSVIVLGVGMYSQTHRNMRYYSVLSLCGASRWQLNAYVIGEVAFLYLLSFALALFIPSVLFGVFTGVRADVLALLFIAYILCVLPSLVRIGLLHPEQIVKGL